MFSKSLLLLMTVRTWEGMTRTLRVRTEFLFLFWKITFESNISTKLEQLSKNPRITQKLQLKGFYHEFMCSSSLPLQFTFHTFKVKRMIQGVMIQGIATICLRGNNYFVCKKKHYRPKNFLIEQFWWLKTES